MNVGLLWFDNDPIKTLDQKVDGAARYYANKYGRQPTVCYVHPTALANIDKDERKGGDDERYKVGGVEVRGNRSVMPHHFWIGIDMQEAVRGVPTSEPE